MRSAQREEFEHAYTYDEMKRRMRKYADGTLKIDDGNTMLKDHVKFWNMVLEKAEYWRKAGCEDEVSDFR